jgi:hypothetical protein
MHAQQQIRVNAASLTAALALFAALAFGAIAGYAIGGAERLPGVIPTAQQPAPQFPAATQPPVREPQNSYD